MNKTLKIKIVVLLGGFSFLAVGVVLFQRPFLATPYSEYHPRWSSSQLDGLQAQLELNEKTHINLKKGCEKKIDFFEGNTSTARATDISFVYVPGFSATRKEIFPVVESLAKLFSANYFLTRFPAHGEAAMDYKNYEPQGFFDTIYEAVEIGALLGKKKVFIGTSTGSALISAALVQKLDIDAAVLISPAFAVYPEHSWILSTRLGDLFKTLFMDEIIKWVPKNPSMERYWNTSYHRDGPAALLKVVDYIHDLDFSNISVPVLILYTLNDEVVINSAIQEKFNQIKDPRKRLVEVPSSNHVLAGEFTSPETTELVIKEIHDWLQLL